ncbi:MAG: 6-phosphogluconolactonase [Planctomycetota bacterium]|jgi:6-phosphogluconolactonase
MGTLAKPSVEIISGEKGLAERSLQIFIEDAQKAIREKDVFYVAISGGHTPKHFFELLGDSPQSSALPWEKVQLFWVDERYVPPDSKSSNYKLAADTFLKKVPIPEDNVHKIPTGYSDVKAAASFYEGAMREAFHLEEKQLPQFDLIVLGMGADGHTGSMFPNSYAAFDTEDLACVVYVLDEKLNRITLTHPVLCAASHLVVLVSGAEKAEILKQVLTSEPDEVRYPIHVLWSILDKVTWLVDAEAAKLL